MDNKTIRHFGKNTLNEFLEELKERVVNKLHELEKALPKKLSDLENDLDIVKTVNGTEPDENGNIEVDMPIKPFPIYSKEIITANGNDITKYIVNIEELEADVIYSFQDKDYTTEYFSCWLSVICDDGTKKELIGTSTKNDLWSFYKHPNGKIIDFYDIKSFNAYHTVDITDKTTVDKVVYSTDLMSEYLPVYNYFEYTPTDNYHPATKKYVDDSVKNIDIPEGFSGSWNDLEDKPFYKEEELIEKYELPLQTIPFGIMAELLGNMLYLYDLSSIFTLDPNTTYTVTMDGLKYTSKPKYFSDAEVYYLGNSKYWGMEDTGEPFIITMLGGELGFCENAIAIEEQSNGKEVSIFSSMKTNVVKKLDIEFVPDEVARMDDIPEVFSGSWNDLYDKPFYDYEDYVSINELLNDIIFIDNNRIEITGVPKLSIQEGKIYNVRLQNEHSTLDYKEVCKYYGNASLGLFGNYLGGTIIDDVEETQNGFIIFQESNNTMYVLVDTNRISLPCTVSVYIGETKSVPLDEKYIPTNIPKIQSAEVGQTIVVKEVDENGKPIEWECVDASGGGDCQMCKMSDFGVYVEEQVGPGEYNRQLTFECTKLPKYGIIFNDLYSSSNTLWKITKNGEELSNLDEDDFYGGADYIFVCTLYGSTSLKMGNSILSIDLINNLYRAQTKES